jgi:hypothetical protein
MAITEAEKKVLLERLEKARVAKQAKAAEAKKAKEAKQAPVPAPAPEPTPAPERSPEPASEPIDIPVVPDLVAASRKPAKKVCLLPSDSEEEEEVILPKKKKTVPVAKKEPKYMKIVLYKEPQDKQAFQQLLEAVNDNGGEYDDEPEAPAPAPREYHKGPRVVQKVGAGPRNTPVRTVTREDIETEELRKLAMLAFG